MSDTDNLSPFAYREGLTRRAARTEDMDTVKAFLDGQEAVTMHESLAIWDLYMQATDYENETMTGEDATDRLSDYPDDYTVQEATLAFEQDESTLTYTITLHGTRSIEGKDVTAPPTSIRGTIQTDEDLDSFLETYDIKAEPPSRSYQPV